MGPGTLVSNQLYFSTSSQYDFLVEKETLSALGRFPCPKQTQVYGPVGFLTSGNCLLCITHRMGTILQWYMRMCAQHDRHHTQNGDQSPVVYADVCTARQRKICLKLLPCAMASLGSWASLSSFSSWTQEAAAIWARAEAQLAATPSEETNIYPLASVWSPDRYQKNPI